MNELTYTMVGDYSLPNLKLPQQPEVTLGLSLIHISSSVEFSSVISKYTGVSSSTYPYGACTSTIDVFYTDANGSLVTPEKLDYGQGYSIVEVQAPYGYVLDDTPVYLSLIHI